MFGMGPQLRGPGPPLPTSCGRAAWLVTIGSFCSPYRIQAKDTPWPCFSEIPEGSESGMKEGFGLVLFGLRIRRGGSCAKAAI